jgi:hypothetical protein
VGSEEVPSLSEVAPKGALGAFRQKGPNGLAREARRPGSRVTRRRSEEMERSFCSAAVVGALMGLVCLIGGGCATDSDTSPYFSVKQEHDIPPPLSFKWDKDNPETFSYIAYDDPKGVGYFRSSTNVYYGDEQIVNLVPWYIEQMKKDGWIHKETSFAEGKKRLVFKKGDETATIWLYRKFDTRMDRNLTFVKAKVSPTPVEAMSTEEAIEIGEPASVGTTPASTAPESIPSLDADLKEIIEGPRGAKEGEANAQPASGRAASQGAASQGAASESKTESLEKPAGKNKQVVNEGSDRENSEDSSSVDEVMKTDDSGA